MKTIPFLKARRFTLGFSVLSILALWVCTFVVHGGFNFSIDFKAGLNDVVSIPSMPSVKDVKAALIKEIDGVEVQKSGDDAYVIRAGETADPNFRENTEAKITRILQASYGSEVKIISGGYVGSRFSGGMARSAILLIAVALAVIMIYLWIRFEIAYAVSALLSTLHDVVFVVGFIGAFHLEVNSATIAAVLTIIGYSLNDTIVIFDRIREARRMEKSHVPLGSIINTAITQTLSRTIITSLTTLLAILALVFIASGSVKLFAVEMVVGIVIGTYSSVFIAGVSLDVLHSAKLRRLSKASASPLKRPVAK